MWQRQNWHVFLRHELEARDFIMKTLIATNYKLARALLIEKANEA